MRVDVSVRFVAQCAFSAARDHLKYFHPVVDLYVNKNSNSRTQFVHLKLKSNISNFI